MKIFIFLLKIDILLHRMKGIYWAIISIPKALRGTEENPVPKSFIRKVYRALRIIYGYYLILQLLDKYYRKKRGRE